jgi:excisionase family DNA binding protein
MRESTTSPTTTGEIDSEQRAYKVPRAAKLLDISERQTWSLVHSGEIESFKVGSSRLVLAQSLDEFIEARRREEAQRREEAKGVAAA